MIVEPFLKPEDDVQTVGRIFDTPLVVKGQTWLPITPVITWGILSWLAARRRPGREPADALKTGAWSTLVVLGSEWCHNLAHAAAAQLAGAPMDALRITFGLPQVVYYQIAPPEVKPRQHITRSLGGAAINSLLLALSLVARSLSAPASRLREVANAAAGMNVFLVLVGLLPMPFLDGGPVLKWSLVQAGQTPEQADKNIQKANAISGAALGITASVLLRKKKWFWGILSLMGALLSTAIAAGLIKEMAGQETAAPTAQEMST